MRSEDADRRTEGPESPEGGRGPWHVPMTRGAALGTAALAGLGAGLDRAGVAAAAVRRDEADRLATAVPFHGAHQAGIATPQPGHLAFASFDLATSSRATLRRLLQDWTDAAAALTAGREVDPAASSRPGRVPVDPGEAVGLPPAALTLTFGFGPSLFGVGGRDRFGLASRRPSGLRPLPPFPGDDLDPAHSGGDLCVQACADDPQVAFHAVHVLSRIAGSHAILRWLQRGFWPSASSGKATPRNLMGFKDGTGNIRGDDAAAMNTFVWVQPGDGPAWMHGGTYLAARRIEIVLESWDAVTLAEQERVIGRYKGNGAPLGAHHEHDPANFAARNANGDPVIPRDAHFRVAGPAANSGVRILRRGFSYSGGARPGPYDKGGHQIDSGLFFIAFVRDPARQFVPLQRKLSTDDALSMFTIHTASAIFACPPGVRPGGFVGEQLFA